MSPASLVHQSAASPDTRGERRKSRSLTILPITRPNQFEVLPLVTGDGDLLSLTHAGRTHRLPAHKERWEHQKKGSDAISVGFRDEA